MLARRGLEHHRDHRRLRAEDGPVEWRLANLVSRGGAYDAILEANGEGLRIVEADGRVKQREADAPVSIILQQSG